MVIRARSGFLPMAGCEVWLVRLTMTLIAADGGGRGRWYRQWQRWAYAEAYGLWVVIDGDQLRWYDDQVCWPIRL